jgi:hypothetical protein
MESDVAIQAVNTPPVIKDVPNKNHAALTTISAVSGGWSDTKITLLDV